MKHLNILLVALLSLSLAILIGCADNPSAVVKKLHSDGSNWREYCAPAMSRSAIEWLYYDSEIDSCSHTIDGNTASVKVVLKSGRTRTVNLVKLGGEWKVNAARSQ